MPILASSSLLTLDRLGLLGFELRLRDQVLDGKRRRFCRVDKCVKTVLEIHLTTRTQTRRDRNYDLNSLFARIGRQLVLGRDRAAGDGVRNIKLELRRPARSPERTREHDDACGGCQVEPTARGTEFGSGVAK